MENSGIITNQRGVDAENYFFDVFLNGKIKEPGIMYTLANGVEAGRASKEVDETEGTDFFYGGIRFDFTTNYDTHDEKFGKDRIEDFPQKETIEGNMSFWMGITIQLRFGNAKSSFKEPVAVIGGPTTSRYDDRRMAHFICKNWNEIFVKAKKLNDAYKEWREKNGH